jgi:anti-sigma regulatory factor (Ser/Thr protein kinase)
MDTRALTRPATPRKLRITLTAGHAVEAARNEVRAAIRTWGVPVDPAVAVLLTSELVSNALRHEAGRAIELVVSCALGQLQVDVYDTSPTTVLQVDAPAGTQTGAGLMLLGSLASSWGYSQTPTGRAGYFALLF